MENSTKPWYKKTGGILAIIFSAIILFFLAASAFYFIGEIKNAKLKLSQSEIIGQLSESDTKYDASSGDHYWLGSPDAKVTIVEFGDFACPVCGQAFSTVGELRLKYKNDIKFIWRDFPVISEFSAALALAAQCAGEQGLFWPMHDKLFQNQDISQTEEIVTLANQVGADTARFKDCLDKQKYLPRIQKDLSDGQTFGINGTPTYFINGYKLAGDVPYKVFTQIIEQFKK